MSLLPRRRHLRRRIGRATLTMIISIAVVAILGILGMAPRVIAQNVVELTTPSVTNPVADSPPAIVVSFSAAVDATVPATMSVLDRAGTPMAIGAAGPPPDAPASLAAPVLAPLAAGTYLVLWSAQLVGEDTPRAGSFGFRVGPAPGVPGNATELDAWPAAWAVAARLLVIVGIGAAMTSSVSRLLSGPATPRPSPWLVPTGAALAVLGALLMTVLSGPLAGGPLAIPMTPSAIVLVGASLALLVITALDARHALPSRFGAVHASGVVVLAGTALLALGLWSTAVTLPPSALIVVAAVTFLPLVAGLLVSCALLLATAGQPSEPAQSLALPEQDERLTNPKNPGSAPAPAGKSVTGGPEARHGWLMCGLAVAGIVLALLLTGADVANLGIGSFSITTITAALLLVVVLILALLAGRASIRQRLLVPAALLVALPIAGLGLLAPAATATDIAGLLAVDLSASTTAPSGGATLAHLVFQPAMPGANVFAVYLTSDNGAVVESDLPAAVTLTALNEPATSLEVPLSRLAAGPFLVGSRDVPHTGWWQAGIVTGDGGTLASYPLLLPDPNLSGVGPAPTTDAAAATLFQRSLANLTSLRNVALTIDLGSGQGTHGESTIVINTGGDGQPPSYQERSNLYESIIIGDRQWIRIRDEPWQERRAGPINTPANWIITYEHATGFQLGPVVSGPAEPLQLVTFYLPRQYQPRQEPAWFAWWVGTETGQVHQEAMISTQHYMVYRYQGFNTPIEVVPPDVTPPGNATPAPG